MRCCSCGSSDLTAFYSVEGVPVHSCVLVDSREAALAFPQGDIRLELCGSCGFVQNSAFDPGLIDYFQEYEETQGYSATFEAFARGLAAALVARHDLRGKEILEIGCGKGEFLALLCELGGNRGVGIDPAYVPGREGGAASDRIRFVRDLYSSTYSHMEGDFVCCRHTLEHIQPVADFVDTVANTARRRNSLVFFEVPDVVRVLREAAFWDIYHEHCSYFSAGSLARLFRSTGFEVLRVETAFEAQYLLLEAVPSSNGSAVAVAEADLAELRRLTAGFQARCEAVMAAWKDRLAAGRVGDRRTVIWGGGSKGVALLTALGLTSEIECVVDINPHKQGKYMPGTGQQVVAPEYLQEHRPDLIVVMNPVYVAEITAQVRRMGISAEVLAV